MHNGENNFKLRAEGFITEINGEAVMVKTASKSPSSNDKDTYDALKSSQGRGTLDQEVVKTETDREEFVKSYVSAGILKLLIPHQVDDITILNHTERKETGVANTKIAFKSIIIEDCQNYEDFFNDVGTSIHTNSPEDLSADDEDWDTESEDNDEWQKAFISYADDLSFDNYDKDRETEIRADKLEMIDGKEYTFFAEAFVGGTDPNIQNHLAQQNGRKYTAQVVDHGGDLSSFTAFKIIDDRPTLKSNENLTATFFQDFMVRIDEGYDGKLKFDLHKAITACETFSKITDEQIAETVKRRLKDLTDQGFQIETLTFRTNETYVTFKNAKELGEFWTAGLINQRNIYKSLTSCLKNNREKLEEKKDWQKFLTTSDGQNLLKRYNPNLTSLQESNSLYLLSRVNNNRSI